MSTNAVIDMGSNSIRVVVYKTTHNKSFIILDEDKVNARLGTYLDHENTMSEQGIQTAIATLIGFKSLCLNYGVENIDVVATEAIRKARNKNVLCKRIKSSTGLDIRILTGDEETYYDYISVKHSFDIENALIFDIGGSSMELGLIEDGILTHSVNLPLGAIVLTGMFNNISLDEDRLNLREYMTNIFNSLGWMNKYPNIPVIGIGGTARALGKIHKKMYSHPSDLLHNYKIKSAEVKGIYDSFKYIKLDDRNKVKGLSKTRSDIFLAPLGAIDCILSYCDSSILTISEGGIRDGIIFERTLSNYDVSNLGYSVLNIMARNNIDNASAGLISDLSTRVYEKMDNNPYETKLLIISSLLSNIGLQVSSRRKHNHAFYILTNTNIAGLTLKENVMISYIVSRIWKHSFKMPKKFEHLLTEDDINSCNKISSILYFSHLIVRYLGNDSRLITLSEDDNKIIFTIPISFSKFLNEYIPDDRFKDIEKYFDKKIRLQ